MKVFDTMGCYGLTGTDAGVVFKEYNEPVRLMTISEIEEKRQYFKDKAEREKASECHEINPAYAEYGNFVWSIYKLQTPMLLDVTPATVSKLMYLATYMNYNDYLEADNHIAIEKAKLPKILNVSPRTVQTFWKEATGKS